MASTYWEVFFSYDSVTDELKRHRNWFLILGGVLIALGVAAIAFPFIAALSVNILVGVILLLSGALGLIHTFGAKGWKGVSISLINSLLALVVGVLLLLYPIPGILSLSLLIGLFFIATGILRGLLAWRLRPFDQWGWLMASGVVSLLLGVLILFLWPEAASWVLGLLVGIDLIFIGWTLLMLGLAARRALQHHG